MNVAMLLEMTAEAFPDRVAVTSGARRMTFGELLAAARAAAASFRAGGYRNVAVLDVNSLAVPVALFGAAYAGIPYVPLNYRLTPSEGEALLERVAPAALVSIDEYAERLDVPAGITLLEREAFLHAARDRGAPVVTEAPGEPEAVAIQLFTSGTTGRPKAAVLRHSNVMAYILGTVEFGSAAEEDAALISVPPYHIAGIAAVFSATYAGRPMVQLPNFDPATWLALCHAHRITSTFVVPTMLARITEYLESTGTAANVPALRAIAYGGGKMPLPVIETAMRHFPGVDFTNAYGLTETSSTICLLDPDAHRAAMASDDPKVRARLGSVGLPLPSIELQVRDADGRVLGAGESGDVYVRGGQVSGEYLEQGSLLDADGWFPTRDRGYVDDAGYLFLEGRADDVIVRGGENISPGEIEAVLLQHPAVSDAAVVAIPSTQWGEAVGAAVVVRRGQQVSAGELQAWVHERMRSSRVPERIEFRDELPYNEMGKILRRVVKQELAAAAS
jgi:acyl-CoA synthetase (AMP-forming)/AMP-acid ligase II